MEKVESYYDNEFNEWERLDRHKVELDITKRFMDLHIQGECLKILDIGGGAGRYSFYLSKNGNQVSLLDISSKNIEKARQLSKDLGDLQEYIKGNALALPFEDEVFDVVLLMGPMYHLINEEDRRVALNEALRVLKKRGIIFTSFISCYAPMIDHLKNMYKGDKGSLLRYLDDGVNHGHDGFTEAYFISPQDARRFMAESSIEEIEFVCVENALAMREEGINALEGEEYKQWLDIAFKLSRDPNLFGCGEHFLHIGRKPDEISLRVVVDEQLSRIAKLSETLSEAQRNCVADNMYSIAQASFYPDFAWHRGIYLGEEPIGFVMLDVGEQEYYLWRYMIARDYQRKSYGKKVLDMIVDKCRKDGVKVLKTSVELGAESPYDFYIGYGFVDTGEKLDCGEQVLRYDIG